jgi:hypothetical protein
MKSNPTFNIVHDNICFNMSVCFSFKSLCYVLTFFLYEPASFYRRWADKCIPSWNNDLASVDFMRTCKSFYSKLSKSAELRVHIRMHRRRRARGVGQPPWSPKQGTPMLNPLVSPLISVDEHRLLRWIRVVGIKSILKYFRNCLLIILGLFL